MNGYVEHRLNFDEIKHCHAFNEVSDMADGTYDWQIERMQEKGIKI